MTDAIATSLTCHVCGGRMHEEASNMPFKLDRQRIVIIRDLPVWQCASCGEHAFSDPVMVRIEQALQAAGAAEVEVVPFAA